METVYAKSKPPETLIEHTTKLLDNLEILKNTYGNIIVKLLSDTYKNQFWNILTIIVKYHDTGKLNTKFQNKIRENLNLPLLKSNLPYEIPHNLLSPAFFGDDIFKKYNDKLIEVIIQSIVFHHERDNIPDFKLIERTINEDLEKKRELINNLVDVPSSLWVGYEKFYKKRITEKDKDIYLLYILIKGFLHRIDHSSSANVEVEIKDDSLQEKVNEFIRRKGKPREIQKYTKQNQDKNLVIVASTGIGKTEAGLLWASNDKTFFTLPLRVTVNSIYDRVTDENKGIGYLNTGLLHSSNLEHFVNSEDFEISFEMYETSKQLSYQLNISTIDQLLTFPFKYGGYEKNLATLIYSKVIIDEIQAYEPNIVAVILKGLYEINKLGGRFLIMTATLPQIYLDKLNEFNIKFQYKEFLLEMNRHKIKIVNNDILKDIEKMINFSKTKKVLVIVNTVKKAKDIYKILKDNKTSVKMLHSMFIGEDRKRLENEIRNFAPNDKDIINMNLGIWITTQIAEASLDIDFDVLFTELSSLDSLFQRMGRVYRNREYQNTEPNIYIYTDDCSGIGYIYDKDIFELSKEEISQCDNCVLTEKNKTKMVKTIYSEEKLKGTVFLKELLKSLDILENLPSYEMNKKEAQNVLRDIYSVRVIPHEIYDKFQDEVNRNVKMINSSTGKEKFKAKLFFLDKSLDIPFFRAKKEGVTLGEITNLKGFYRVNYKYCHEKGLMFDELISPFV